MKHIYFYTGKNPTNNFSMTYYKSEKIGDDFTRAKISIQIFKWFLMIYLNR